MDSIIEYNRKRSAPTTAFASYFPFWTKLTTADLFSANDTSPDPDAILLVINLNQKTWDFLQPHFSCYKKKILIQFEAKIGWEMAYTQAPFFDHFISFDRAQDSHPGFHQMFIPYDPKIASSGRDKRGKTALLHQWKSSRKLFLNTYLFRFLPRKKKCVLIASLNPNLHYQIRKTIAEKWPEDIDVFGGGWPKTMTNYRGWISSKLDVLTRYRYCLVMENQRQPGYITEKLLDCFPPLTIPIYWGAPDVHDYPGLDWVPTIEDENSAMDEIVNSDTLYETLKKKMLLDRQKVLDQFSTEKFIKMVCETIEICAC